MESVRMHVLFLNLTAFLIDAPGQGNVGSPLPGLIVPVVLVIVLVCFLAVVTIWAKPNVLNEKIVGFVCALLAALASGFFAGNFVVALNPTTGATVQATGGMGIFVFVFWQWRRLAASTQSTSGPEVPPNKVSGLKVRKTLRLGALVFLLLLLISLPAVGVSAYKVAVSSYKKWKFPEWSSMFASRDPKSIQVDWSGQTQVLTAGNSPGVCGEAKSSESLLLVSGDEPAIFQALPHYGFEDFDLSFRVHVCRYQKVISWLIRFSRKTGSYYRFNLVFGPNPQGTPGSDDYMPAYSQAEIHGYEYRNWSKLPGELPLGPIKLDPSHAMDLYALLPDMPLTIYLEAQNKDGVCRFLYRFRPETTSIMFSDFVTGKTSTKVDKASIPAQLRYLEPLLFQGGEDIILAAFDKEFDVKQQDCLRAGPFGFVASSDLPLAVADIELNNEGATYVRSGGDNAQ